MARKKKRRSSSLQELGNIPIQAKYAWGALVLVVGALLAVGKFAWDIKVQVIAAQGTADLIHTRLKDHMTDVNEDIVWLRGAVIDERYTQIAVNTDESENLTLKLLMTILESIRATTEIMQETCCEDLDIQRQLEEIKKKIESSGTPKDPEDLEDANDLITPSNEVFLVPSILQHCPQAHPA